MPRPKRAEEARSHTIYLGESVWQALCQMADDQGVSKSAVLEGLLEAERARAEKAAKRRARRSGMAQA